MRRLKRDTFAAPCVHGEEGEEEAGDMRESRLGFGRQPVFSAIISSRVSRNGPADPAPLLSPGRCSHAYNSNPQINTVFTSKTNKLTNRKTASRFYYQTTSERRRELPNTRDVDCPPVTPFRTGKGGREEGRRGGLGVLYVEASQRRHGKNSRAK